MKEFANTITFCATAIVILYGFIVFIVDAINTCDAPKPNLWLIAETAILAVFTNTTITLFANQIIN